MSYETNFAYYWIAGALSLAYFIYCMYRAQQFDRPSDKPKEAETNSGPFKYPGYIPYKDNHGCYLAKFKNNRDINTYFGPNGAGWLKSIVEVIPAPDGSIYVMYTNSLTEEMKDDLAEWSYNQHSYFEQKKAERIELKKEETRKAAAAEKEAKHYEDIGRKYAARTNSVKLLAPGSVEREKAEAALKKGDLNE